MDDLLLLCVLILIAATVYSSVGHAGASGYLAAMALVGVVPEVMKPTALVLNIIVASLGTYRLARAKLTDWRALGPLALASVPCAFIGGSINLPGQWYRILVGLVLIFAALRLIVDPREPSSLKSRSRASLPVIPALIGGGAIGFLAGLTGTGGGVFLSPLLILLGWTSARQSAGLTAPFILINSAAGLAGNLASMRWLPAELPYFAMAALAGGLIGTQLVIHWMSPRALQRVLAAVLLVAAGKFLLT